jgi:hypothetical protein
MKEVPWPNFVDNWTHCTILGPVARASRPPTQSIHKIENQIAAARRSLGEVLASGPEARDDQSYR